MIEKEQYVQPNGGDRLFWGKRIFGFFLIFIGVIMLICFMPSWLWLALLGLLLIGVGCFVLAKRF
jgi:thiol:disulfide interchange protein